MGFYDLIEKVVYSPFKKDYNRREFNQGFLKLVAAALGLNYLNCSKKEEPKKQLPKQETKKVNLEEKNLDDYLSTLTNEDP